MLVPLVVLAAITGRWKRETSRWLLILPLAWLAWQFVAATQTVSRDLTAITLKHFVVVVLMFYIGWFAVSDLKRTCLLWIGILIGFIWMLRVGFDQHFGGLEATQKYFFLYIYPSLKELPVELMKKMETRRIYATLFYPNTLAAALLLFTPLVMVGIWDVAKRFNERSRVLLISAVTLAAVACLYWSGSKSGWLLALFIVVGGMVQGRLSKRVKIGLACAIVVLGSVAFAVKFAAFFKKGAPSVAARAYYWKAAVQNTMDHPLVGSGPGTFSVPYQKLKPTEAEMARLCHNDYLEQATDSGVPGFVLYLAFVGGVLVVIYRKVAGENLAERLVFLGVVAVLLQSISEFNLYIPAIAWPAFLIMGRYLGKTSQTPASAA